MSQGTSSLMALLSNRPEYNSKIIQAHLFAPVAFMKYLPNPYVKAFLVPLIDVAVERNIKFVNLTDILIAASPLTKVFCNVSINPVTTEFCKAIVFAFAGSNTFYSEIDTVRVIFLVKFLKFNEKIPKV